MVSRSLIDNHLSGPADPASICYFFFKDGRGTLDDALCALLHQLFIQQPHLLAHAASPWRHHGRDLLYRTDKLVDILKAAALDEMLQPTICVLDGLDECREVTKYSQERSGCLTRQLMTIIKTFKDLERPRNRKASFKLLVTCRPNTDLWNEIRGLSNDYAHVLSAAERPGGIRKEIKIFIEAEVKQLALELRIPFKVQERVTAELCAREYCTFLEPRLLIDKLYRIFETEFKPEDVQIPLMP